MLAATGLAAMLLIATHSRCYASSPRTAPSWVFPISPSPTPPLAARAQTQADVPLQLPGSSQHFTTRQIADLYAVPDWYPQSHPPMPPIVAVGHKPAVMACGYCHLPDGQGRPENAPLAGLTGAYIAEQITEFRTGQRLSVGPVGAPLAGMLSVARNLDANDTAAAADYFSKLRYHKWIRVIEARQVPRTHVVGGMYQTIPGAGSEPLGDRIIEVPENTERTELRDARSGFIAYVPRGSLTRGAELVRHGANGRTIRCAICHGADLRGLASVPPIAGRSPSYLMRQLYDIKYAARTGLWTALMREPLAKLSNSDLVAIVAYVASLPP